MLARNTIMPVELYGDTLKAMFFGDYYNHSTVIIQGVPSGDILNKIENVTQMVENDDVLIYPCIEIKGLEQGTYIIYTTTADGSEQSTGYSFTITGDSKAQVLQQAAESIGTWQNTYVKNAVEDISNSSNEIKWLRQKYDEAKSASDKLDIALTLYTYVELLNKRMQKCGFTSEPFVLSNLDATFHLDGEAIRVVRHNMLNKKCDVFIPRPLQETCHMQEEDNEVYLYAEIGESCLPINFAISFKLDTKTASLIKENIIQRGEVLQRALERTIDYPQSYLAFSERELEWVSIIDKLRGGTPMFRSPKVLYEHGVITISPHEDDTQLLNLVSGNLYLAINELEYCLDNNRRRVKMQPQEFYLFNDSLGLGTEPYLYWIENQDGQILSDIKVLNLSVDSEMGGIVYDTDDEKYINERLRKLELYHYKKHLVPIAQNNTSNQKVFDKIMESFAVCETDGETAPAGVADNIIDRNLTRNNIMIFAELRQAVVKDQITYSKYGTEIVKDPFYYRSKLNTIVLPMGQDILYKIVTYDFEEGRKVEYVPALKQSTREYRFDNVEWAYVTAIDVNDMRTSGYIMLDFSKRGISADVHTYMAMSVEVGY